MDTIRLLIIEDNNLLREGFVELLKNHEKMEVRAISGDEEKLAREITRFAPHVILLNSGLQSQHNVDFVPWVIKRFPDTKIVVMDLSLSKNGIIEYMDAGVVGFILKDATPQEFVKTIKDIAKGEMVIPGDYADLLLSQIVEHAVVKGKIDLKESVQITEFELKLLKLINEGLSDKKIGENLGITSESVKNRLHSIKQNLSLFSLLELVHVITPGTPSSRG